MSRFTGDFSGECEACGEYVEFAIGVQTGREPVAMHFGPRGAENITLSEFELLLMVDEELDVKFRFVCPLCGGESAGRAACKGAAMPG
jgi:hypothetical protein